MARLDYFINLNGILETDVKMMSYDSDDEEYFSLDNSEILQKLKMCPKQRKLYDDFLEDPKTK